MRKYAIKDFHEDMVEVLGKAVLKKNIKDKKQTTWNKKKYIEIEKYFHQGGSFSFRNLPSFFDKVLPDLHFSFLPVSRAEASQFLEQNIGLCLLFRGKA